MSAVKPPIQLDSSVKFLRSPSEYYAANLIWRINEWSVVCKDNTPIFSEQFRDCNGDFIWQLKLEPSFGSWKTGKCRTELKLRYFGSTGITRVCSNVKMSLCFLKFAESCEVCMNPEQNRVIPDDSDSFDFLTTQSDYATNLSFIFCEVKEEPGLRVHCQITYKKQPSKERGNVILVSKLKELLSDKTFSDVNVTAAGGVTFPAHKGILAVRSPVFRAMFQTMMTEAIQNQVDLSTFSPVVVKGLLEYVYTENAKIDLSKLGEYLRIVDMYELGGLKAKVELLAATNLKVENAVEVFQCATLYSALLLKEKVVQFLKMNGKAITATPEFAAFVKSNPTATVELFSLVFD